MNSSDTTAAKSNEAVFWFRVPDNEAMLMGLMGLPLAQLKCYLVVSRAIQRDRNAGKISSRQVAKRARLSLRHAHKALAELVDAGHLRSEGKPGATAIYSLPHSWNLGNCFPTGAQLADSETLGRSPVGERLERHCAPVGKQNCSPVGEQHLESSKKHIERREVKNPNPPRGYALDEQFADFMAACRNWGMNLVEPEDFYEAYRFEWRKLDFLQRRAAIENIRARIAAEVDPLGWKPKNFLKGEYKRAIKVPELRRRR